MDLNGEFTPSEEDSTSPTQRCLAIAERIIFSLSDANIVQRYKNFRDKLFARQPSQSTLSQSDVLGSSYVSAAQAYAYFQSQVKQNSILKQQIAELEGQKPNFDKDIMNNEISEKIRNLAERILPSQKLPPKGNAVQELDTLKIAIDAKLDALNYMRDELKTKNRELRNNYEVLTRTLAQKKEDSKEREEEEIRKSDELEKSLSEELNKAQRDLDLIAEKYEIASEENATLRQKYSDTTEILEGIHKDLAETEAAIEQMENESESMFAQIEEQKTLLNVKTKELNSVQTVQSLGLEAGEGLDITDVIQSLRKKVETLKTENSQMSFEIKRMEKRQSQTASTMTMDGISMDEDELASQILKSKWH